MTRRLVPNPGGSVVPNSVIGRDAEIFRLWDTLATRSVLLLAPRRMGKTSLCRKMSVEPREGYAVRMRDLEGRTRAADLVHLLFEDVERLLSPARQVGGRARAVVERLVGTVESKWFTVRIPEQDWRLVLDALLDDLDAQAVEHKSTLVLIWDEFPLFIRDIARSGHQEEAMQLLDLLRAARARCHHLRMLFTGSIGLHEVIRGLKKAGYANDPVNDMAKELVDVLPPLAARELAVGLLLGIGHPNPEVAERIATECEGHPYIIHHVAHQLRYAPQVDVPAVDRVLSELLEGSQDPLDLYHYLERLSQAFDDADLPVVKAILDVLAVAPEGLTLAQIRSRLVSQGRESVSDRLHELRRDLYLERTGELYTFRLTLLRRWWARERGL